MAIVDTLGPVGSHITQSSNHHRLLAISGNRPKVPEICPSGNFLLFLMSSRKHHLSLKKTDLKHLTLKIAFLLALATSKCRSKIHARDANKAYSLSQWEKVALFPFSEFIAKTQLAREDSQSVSPVTIPVLTTIVDRQFKEETN